MPLPFERSKLRKDSNMYVVDFVRKYNSMNIKENVFLFGCLFCLFVLVVTALLFFTTGCVTIGRSATTTSSQTTTPNISLSFVHIGDMQTTSGTKDTDSRQESNAKLQDTLKDLLKADIPIDHLDVGGVGGGVSKGVSSVKEKAKSKPKIPSIRKDNDRSPSTGDGNAPEASALWKPVSETTHQLVVLLDSSYTGHVSGVALEENGEIIQGRFASIANGNREHYRGFGKAGSGFSPPVTMIVTLKDGTVHSGVINSPAGRDQVSLNVQQ
jgi:hypothetical protein